VKKVSDKAAIRRLAVVYYDGWRVFVVIEDNTKCSSGNHHSSVHYHCEWKYSQLQRKQSRSTNKERCKNMPTRCRKEWMISTKKEKRCKNMQRRC